MHRFLLHNGQIRDTTEPLLAPGQVGFMNGWGIFTTLRVADGVVFAFERHYQRLRRDAALVRVPFPFSAPDLQKTLLSLVDANRAFNATLRVAIVRNRGGLFEAPQLVRDADLVAFTADLATWNESVKLSYVPHGRYAAWPYAGTKLTSWAHNLTWYEQAHEDGFDEVILLNEHDQISECTSANIFIIKGDHVWTPPVQSSGCLPGVTRAILLEEIQIPGLTIAERELTASDLEESDQVFITSTTRDLIPVLEIDRQRLHQNRAALKLLQDAFSKYRSQYIAKHGRHREVLAV
ncbi:MAG TPA: aminotransferase class IV [Bryobacteraceae bacterium]|nr:aminotransferase class IV [Bryobacteraceae bacterium]